MKQFDSFRLDIVNHCLWRGKVVYRLRRKLSTLVEHADRLAGFRMYPGIRDHARSFAALSVAQSRKV